MNKGTLKNFFLELTFIRIILFPIAIAGVLITFGKMLGGNEFDFVSAVIGLACMFYVIFEINNRKTWKQEEDEKMNIENQIDRIGKS